VTRSIAVSGRSPSRTTKAASAASSPSTSTVTAASMSSSRSVVWSTSASEMPSTATPPVPLTATATIRQSLLPSAAATVNGRPTRARPTVPANDSGAGLVASAAVLRAGSRRPPAV
jgi:hypothetical protein